MGQQSHTQVSALSGGTGSSDSELDRRLTQDATIRPREKRRVANREAARRLRQRRQEQVLQLEGELASARKATDSVTRKLDNVQSAHRKAVAEVQVLRAELAGLKMSLGLSAPMSQLDVASASLAASTGVLPSAHLLTMPAPLFPTGLMATAHFAADQVSVCQQQTAAHPETSRPESVFPAAGPSMPGCKVYTPGSTRAKLPKKLGHNRRSSPRMAYAHLDAPARGLLDAVALHCHEESEASLVCATPDSVHEGKKKRSIDSRGTDLAESWRRHPGAVSGPRASGPSTTDKRRKLF